MNDALTRCCAPLGRVLLSMIFLMSGVQKLMQWDQTADHMRSEGMVAVPFLLVAAAVVELLGGLSVLLGWKARGGALLLALFLIPVTAIFHDFWQVPADAQMNQMQHFAKNLAIIGGLVMIAALGPGPVSIDAHPRRTA